MARHSEPNVCHSTHERARYMLKPIDIIQQISPVPTIKKEKEDQRENCMAAVCIQQHLYIQIC